MHNGQQITLTFVYVSFKIEIDFLYNIGQWMGLKLNCLFS